VYMQETVVEPFVGSFKCNISVTWPWLLVAHPIDYRLCGV
jgi:hypothetical protein